MAKEEYCKTSCKFSNKKERDKFNKDFCELGYKQVQKTKEATINYLLNHGVICPMNPWKSAAYQIKSGKR